jgi:hypothetical protein
MADSGSTLFAVPEEIAPGQRDLRMSDAERERVVGWLHAAVTEGRLTLAEFSDRVQGVLAAKTYAEIQPYLHDLPPAGAPSALVASDPVELVATATDIRRFGDWVVPPRMVLRLRDGSAKLDFTKAVIRYPVVEIEVDASRSSCVLVLPRGATADISGVATRFGRASCKLPEPRDGAPPGPRFVVRGWVRVGRLRVRSRG